MLRPLNLESGKELKANLVRNLTGLYKAASGIRKGIESIELA